MSALAMATVEVLLLARILESSTFRERQVLVAVSVVLIAHLLSLELLNSEIGSTELCKKTQMTLTRDGKALHVVQVLHQDK